GSIKMAALEHDKLPESRSSRHAAMTFPKSLRRNRSLSFVFWTFTCSDLVRTFHPTLTTTALYRSSSDWFETRS
ncbi:hypothetical protein ACFFNA_38965, partial [Mesorhizobium kowhaii]|uniref:hypothetical protein n=1 Tax=Mesorhizobium kowhaii TaxID=1300272 RepID=UPI0035E8A955